MAPPVLKQTDFFVLQAQSHAQRPICLRLTPDGGLNDHLR
jgi:hypothetical protein